MQNLQSVNNPIITANQYLLEWKTPSKAHKTLILVEGKDDREFYYKFFQDSNSEIKTSGGCGAFRKVYNCLQGKIKNIAIKDSDFARLCHIFPTEDNIFYADAHDYEMMCLKNESTRQEIFENLAITYNEDLWKQILQELNILSYFKWYNYCEHLKYNFKTFSVEGLSSEQLKDFEYIHTQILPKSNPNRIITANYIESFQRDHSPCCEYELTNGHDFIKRFCHHLRINDLIHRQENENSIRNRLHPCFRLEAFVQTQLYQDISDWENANGSNILKKPN